MNRKSLCFSILVMSMFIVLQGKLNAMDQPKPNAENNSTFFKLKKDADAFSEAILKSDTVRVQHILQELDPEIKDKKIELLKKFRISLSGKLRPVLEIVVSNKNSELLTLLLKDFDCARKYDLLANFKPEQKKLLFELPGCQELAVNSAIFSNDYKTLKFFIDSGKVDLNKIDESGQTAFHWAAGKSSLEIVKYFVEVLKFNINLETKDNDCWMPLHCAAATNKPTIVAYLIKKGAWVDAPGRQNAPPLYRAIMNNKLETVEYLVEKANANVKSINLMIQPAARKGLYAIVAYLIKTEKTFLELKDTDLKDLLHEAAAANQVEIMKYLIEIKKVNPETSNTEGLTPLHIAVAKNNLDAVTYLVGKIRVHVDAQDHNKATPLHWAAANGRLEIVQYLVEKSNTNLEAEDNDQMTPLLNAVIEGHIGTIEYLVRKGAVVKRDFPQQAKSPKIAEFLESVYCWDLIKNGGQQIEPEVYLELIDRIKKAPATAIPLLLRPGLAKTVHNAFETYDPKTLQALNAAFLLLKEISKKIQPNNNINNNK